MTQDENQQKTRSLFHTVIRLSITGVVCLCVYRHINRIFLFFLKQNHIPLEATGYVFERSSMFK